MESESGNGSGFNKTAFTTLKIAVFAPIPSVSTASAESVKPGFLRSTRTAWTSDRRKSLIGDLLKVHRMHAVFHPLCSYEIRAYDLRTKGRNVRLWDASVRSGDGSRYFFVPCAGREHEAPASPSLVTVSIAIVLEATSIFPVTSR